MKKNQTRKIITLAVALCMLFSLYGIPAFAAGDGSLSDPYIGGNDYGNTNENGSIILNKLDISAFEKTKAEELIQDRALSPNGEVFYKGNAPTGQVLNADDVIGTYTTTDSSTPVNVTRGELANLGNIIFRIEQVALTSGANPGSGDPDDYDWIFEGIDDYAKTDAVGLIEWTGLPYGYYRITEMPNDSSEQVGINRFIVSVPMVDPENDSVTIDTVYVYPKNRAVSGPIIEKEKPDINDYNGNILTWTIKAEIPATLKTPQGVQSYVITDTMGPGLFYAGNMKVFYKSNENDEPLTPNVDYTVAGSPGDTTFTITLESTAYAKLVGAISGDVFDQDENGRYILYVTYDTVVNISQEDFEDQINPENEVTLDFKNSDGNEYQNKDEPVPVDEFACLKLIKKDGADESILLPNAKFKIYTGLSGQTVDLSTVLKDGAGQELEFTTDANGVFTYNGLGAGDYYLVETAAPNGYKKLNQYTKITISETDVQNNEVLEATVLNYLDNGFTLPTTGGEGTIPFIVLGVALIVTGGLVIFVMKRRQRFDNRK